MEEDRTGNEYIYNTFLIKKREWLQKQIRFSMDMKV